MLTGHKRKEKEKRKKTGRSIELLRNKKFKYFYLCCGDLPGTARAVTVEPVVRVARVWEGVVAAEVVTRPRVVVVDDVWMHVVHAIVHDGGGHIHPSHALHDSHKYYPINIINYPLPVPRPPLH